MFWCNNKVVKGISFDNYNTSSQEWLDREDKNYAEDANILRNADKKNTLLPENMNALDDKNSADEAKVQINENYAQCAEVLRTAEKDPVPPENQCSRWKWIEVETKKTRSQRNGS